MKTYIFKSDRLGFRNWEDTDIDVLHQINSDKEVMEFFPSCPSLMETHDFVHRMRHQYQEKGFCYFAVDLLENASLIGFIGLSTKDFEADFTPCVDIGWRIKKSEWNKGYATEGAQACLEYAFHTLKLPHIVAIAPAINVKSELVMKKIGMSKVKNFMHPLLANDVRLRDCVLYEKNNPIDQ